MDSIPPPLLNNEKSRTFAQLVLGMKLFMESFVSLGLYGQGVVNAFIDQNPELSEQIEHMKEMRCAEPFPFPGYGPSVADGRCLDAAATSCPIDFAAVDGLCPSLMTPKARKIWTKAYWAGVVDANLQPLLEFDSEMAVFANVFNQALGFSQKGRWLPFERLWHKKNLSRKFNNVFGCAKYDELQSYFNGIVSPA